MSGRGRRRTGTGGFGRGFGRGFQTLHEIGDGEGLDQFVPDPAEDLAAAVFGDGGMQFVPERVAAADAHVSADVGEHGADRLAEDLAGDAVGGGPAHEQRERVGLPRLLGPGLSRPTRPGCCWDDVGARRRRGFWLGVGSIRDAVVVIFSRRRRARRIPTAMRVRISTMSVARKLWRSSAMSFDRWR